MALNFPNNPAVNDTVELAGKTYQWDGVKWRMVYVVTPTPPTEQALAPTITEVSTSDSTIVFTLTNNDTESAVILYETNDTVPDENSIELAGGATSGNLTISGLTVSPAILYASANVVGKVKSNITERSFTFPVFVYTAATGGTTLEYDSGGKRYKSHTFTSSGTFTVTTVGDAIDDRNKVDYLIIAGGAAGGVDAGGGGGAGGFLTTITPTPGDTTAKAKKVVTAQSYTITVGLGGANSANASVRGSAGSNSLALGETAEGGGGGGSGGAVNGGNGGSGGGGRGRINTNLGGTGISGQGRNGSSGGPSSTFSTGGAGGGGGAGGIGATVTNDNGAAGGAGLGNTLRTGSTETRAGGGGGGTEVSASGGSGGSGGGGTGGTRDGASATNGTVNTGSGGGGSAPNQSSGSGGSGLVVIRYEIAPSV